MKQDRDWIEVMRSALRDAEATPPAKGWERLERELGAAASGATARRLPLWRVAAVAAAILVCVAAGSYLWQTTPETYFESNILSTATEGSAVKPSLVVTTPPESPLAMVSTEPRVAAPVLRVSPHATMKSQVQHTMSHPVALSTPSPEVEVPPQSTQTTDVQPARQSRTAEAPTRSGSLSAQREPFVAYRAPHKHASMALFAGGGVTGGHSLGNPGASVQRLFSDIPIREGFNASATLFAHDYAQSSFRHYQPFSFGLSVRKELGYGFSLESGITYTMLLSSVTLPFATEDFTQKLHFIGVPLRLNWNFLERSNFNLYIGAGGLVEKCVSAKFGSTTVDEPRVQWSVAGAVGAEYRLGGRVGLYFEPEASYYFTQTELRTARTDSPLTLTLRLGVRLSF